MMGAAVDLARFYTDAYTLADADRAEAYGEWRTLGARTKADHVAALCARAGVRPDTLVEIGCGAGSLLAELAARGVAPRLDGFDLSAPAVEIARSHGIPGVRVEVFDGERVPAGDGAYDLAVVSHVLEHVPQPAALLAEAARVAPWVLVEVPLEDNRSASPPGQARRGRPDRPHPVLRPGGGPRAVRRGRPRDPRRSRRSARPRAPRLRSGGCAGTAPRGAQGGRAAHGVAARPAPRGARVHGPLRVHRVVTRLTTT